MKKFFVMAVAAILAAVSTQAQTKRSDDFRARYELKEVVVMSRHNIRSKGDQALFNLSTVELKNKLGVPEKRPVADFLPTVNIKAKDFAAEMTNVNVQTKDLYGVEPIAEEHVDNNLAVRKIMLERGIVPEELPAEEDVKKVERRLAKEDKKSLGES